jgi:hypothetical protein
VAAGRGAQAAADAELEELAVAEPERLAVQRPLGEESRGPRGGQRGGGDRRGVPVR